MKLFTTPSQPGPIEASGYHQAALSFAQERSKAIFGPTGYPESVKSLRTLPDGEVFHVIHRCRAHPSARQEQWLTINKTES